MRTTKSSGLESTKIHCFQDPTTALLTQKKSKHHKDLIPEKRENTDQSLTQQSTELSTAPDNSSVIPSIGS